MAITDSQRYQLHRSLEEKLGPDEANTLMEHLPPVGWADVATKDDVHQADLRLTGKIESLDVRLSARIDNVETRLSARIDVLDHRLTGQIESLDHRLTGQIAGLSTEMHRTLRTNAYLTIGGTAALVTLVSAIAGLTG
ncbi:MAG: hypothetical protein JJE52_04920 [Acidimicrobiia bacterium]|nr:hypothetical protein [Acidimicrobiia bacterium]